MSCPCGVSTCTGLGNPVDPWEEAKARFGFTDETDEPRVLGSVTLPPNSIQVGDVIRFSGVPPQRDGSAGPSTDWRLVPQSPGRHRAPYSLLRDGAR